MRREGRAENGVCGGGRGREWDGAGRARASRRTMTKNGYKQQRVCVRIRERRGAREMIDCMECSNCQLR